MNTNTNSKVVCLYHKDCQDGYFAAAAVYMYHKDHLKHTEVVFKEVVYGEEPDYELIKDATVWVVDFSYSVEHIKKMATVAGWVTQIDHHATPVRAWDGIKPPYNVTNHFDITKSGAMLTWEWFYDDSNDIPVFTKLSQDYDLWQFKYKNTKPFIEYVYNIIKTTDGFTGFDKIYKMLHTDIPKELRIHILDGIDIDGVTKQVSNDFDQLLIIGRTLIHGKNTLMLSILERNLFVIEVNGYAVPIANIPKEFASEAGNVMSKSCPFSVTYEENIETSMYTVSLRSQKDGMDVSKIAEQFGGGGHKNAAGFITSYKPRNLLSTLGMSPTSTLKEIYPETMG